MTAALAYLKAIVGLLAPAIIIGIWATTKVSPGHSEITDGEWMLIFTAAGGTSLSVWGVPNKDPKGERQDESVQPPTRRRRRRR